MKEIRWGLIGCGNVTEVKSGPAFNKVDGSELQIVMRRNKELAKDYAYRHKVPQWTGDAQEVIDNESLDAIYIATPPGSHADYAIKAMQAGKAAYVEKPMAATYEQCQAMLDVSKQTGQPLFVAYYRRTLPGFLKVKELIEQGEIGKVLYVNIRLLRPPTPAEFNDEREFWRLNKEQAGGGIFYDLASHQLDYLDFLFGPIEKAQGLASNRGGFYDVEDTVSASFRFSNGVLGNGLWSFVTSEDAREDSIEVVGSDGKLVFSSFQHTPVQMFKDGQIFEYPYLNPENIQYHLIKQVVESCRGIGVCVSTGESAARTNKIMEMIIGE